MLQALLLAAEMFWEVGWTLVLGFLLSGLVQAVVSKERMQQVLGRDGAREIALASAYGAASSSCSYAAAALSKTLFKKGAALVPSLAFLFASTNLVIELGIILWLLMGWQFMAAEWIGGVVLIVLLALIVKVTYPRALVEEARAHIDQAEGHEHGDNVVEGPSLRRRLANPLTPIVVAQNMAMDWAMLRTDLLIGFLIAGALMAWVPQDVWHRLFLGGSTPPVQLIANAVVAPLIAVISFVCSIGNVPLAAALWVGGISFGGVLSFLYADLIVLPLLDVYRRYYGLRMALYMAAAFYVTMVMAGLIMQLAFSALHAVPAHGALPSAGSVFSFNYTFWLNMVFGALALRVWILNRRHPMTSSCHGEHAHHH